MKCTQKLNTLKKCVKLKEVHFTIWGITYTTKTALSSGYELFSLYSCRTVLFPLPAFRRGAAIYYPCYRVVLAIINSIE